MGLDIRVTDFSTLSRRVRPGKYADWIRENVGDRQPKSGTDNQDCPDSLPERRIL